MVPCRKIRWFERWFTGQVRHRLTRQFSAVRVRGLENLRSAAAAGPVLVVSNHTAWWDSMLAIALVTGVARLDGYALMEARNLRRFPFLGRVGGFGVERDVPGDGARAIAYGAALLDRPGRVVWVFPEGREQPARRRPLHFKRGAASMVQAAAAGQAARWVPVGLDYVFGADERPAVWIAFGRPHALDGAGVDTLAQRQAEAVTAELHDLEAAVERFVDTGRADADFPVVLAGRRDTPGALATALLGRMMRFRALDSAVDHAAPPSNQVPPGPR